MAQPEAKALPGGAGRLCVLVVDDSRMQRRILTAQLTQAGYFVREAASGEEALAICRAAPPDIVLSDWLMPGLSGLEFCRIFRGMERQSYGYFVLLTSRPEKTDVALGLQAGADDFLQKPVNGAELRARLAAGARVLQMERELKEKNRMLAAALAEMRGLYDTIGRDLDEARNLQQSLIRERFRSFGSAQVSLMLHPSGHVGGDLVGFFPINARRVGLYGIDVSGHGITSALLASRISGYLSGAAPEQNIALVQTDLGFYDARDPAELATAMNRLILEEIHTESYFTMIYADVDLVSGRVALVQAGHPAPVVLRSDGGAEFPGQGGLPIGLFDAAEWGTVNLRLCPGDRLLLGSDGITEAEGAGGALASEGLGEMMRSCAGLRGQAFLDALYWQIEERSSGHLADDISAVLFEFDGAKRNAD
ncbi:PP2C family protein-serine/threonine phosphatase [Paenirhodobacter enshiensis]|uniref:PP2C family protein-serine/threonine phosphatase n=1 Tax=Paenirhodobacter enshiensis TaxID=1105367 RepID=UPI0035B3FBE2